MDYLKIVKHYKGVTYAAKQLGFTRATIYQWRTRGIPHRTQKLIESISNGKLKANDK